MQFRIVWMWLCVVLVALVATSTASAASTLDYSSPQDEYLQPFGNPDTQTYGQTLTVPAGETSLRSFTFYVALPDDLPFRGELYQWDAAKQQPVGPKLYESPTTFTSDASNTTAVSFDTYGAAVVPGRQYVTFLTTARDSGPDETGAVAVNSANPYGGGSFVYANSNGGGFARLFSAPWNDGGELSGYDMAFKASFAPGPLVRGNGTIGRANAKFSLLVEGPQAAPSGSASLTSADGSQSASGSVTCVRVVNGYRAVVGVHDTGAGGRYYEFYVEDRPGGDRVAALSSSSTPPPAGCRSRTPAPGSGQRIASGDIVVRPGV